MATPVSPESVTQSIYDGSATIGRVKSYIGIVVLGLSSIAMIAIAIYLFSINESNLIDTKATIVSATCDLTGAMSSPNTPTYSCNIQIKYNVGGKDYTSNVMTSGSTVYYPGNTIDITYDLTNPSQVTTKQFRYKYVASILISVALLLCGCAWLNYYMTSQSKAYAAMNGLSSIRMFG